MAINHTPKRGFLGRSVRQPREASPPIIDDTMTPAQAVKAAMDSLEREIRDIRETAEAHGKTPVTVAMMGVENAVARVVDQISPTPSPADPRRRRSD